MLNSGESNLGLLATDLKNLAEKKEGPVDIDLSYACRCLNAVRRAYKMPSFIERDITPYKYEYKNDDVIVLFSGGKVSTATALRLKEMNKNVLLWHHARDEADVSRIQSLADEMRLPLLIYYADIKDSDYYSLAMATKAILYAVREMRSPKVYMGCFEMASVQNNRRQDWKYCDEFISAYNRTVAKYVDGARVMRLLPSYGAVDDILSSYRTVSSFFA